MKTAIATLLLTLWHHTSTTTFVPDLCADVYLGTDGHPITDAVGKTLARFCEWTGPHAPVWDANVCCEVGEQGVSCSTTTKRGMCSSGVKMYCEYGEVLADQSVVCYQPFPSTCETSCGGTVQSSDYIQEDVLCCQNGDCYEWDLDVVFLEDCLGELSWCSAGYLKLDGTVDCWY